MICGLQSLRVKNILIHVDKFFRLIKRHKIRLLTLSTTNNKKIISFRHTADYQHTTTEDENNFQIKNNHLINKKCYIL